MARFIGSDGDTNVGESLFASALMISLDDNHIFYKNREVYGQEFDFCLLIPEIGIVVIEVKGWAENTVQEVVNDGRTVLIKTEDGTVPQMPWRQAKGYRFSLMRRIRTAIGKNPLVFSMLAYPQISKDVYSEKRLNTISEEHFTFCAEDIASPVAFRAKLNQGIANARNWGQPDAFNRSLMYQVRSIFECDIEISEHRESEDNEEVAEKLEWLVKPYSYLVYIAANEENTEKIIDDLIQKYAKGTKIYLLVEDSALVGKTASAVDILLKERGLRRNKDWLEAVFGEVVDDEVCYDGLTDFNCFNFQITSIKQDGMLPNATPFIIKDGQGIDRPEIIGVLRIFDRYSNFNLHQYQIEHASSRKNILVRAGAGTGKTYAMISRIAYLCYAEGIWPGNTKNRFVMITFTVDAAENMKQRLKACFQNYYLLTKNPDFIKLISQIDNMQISTIHSYAKKIIEYLGSEAGYGQEIRITTSQFYRRSALEDVLEEYISQNIAIDRDYIQKLGVPVYDLRNRISGFIEQLQSKSIDVKSLTPEHFGNLVNNRGLLLHDLLSSVIPEVEARYALKLKQDNILDLGNLMSTLGSLVSQCSDRLHELSGQMPQYMFIDEFQDTDDVQIDTLLQLSKIVGYHLFVVGDIKQCIYRFRGAEEMAFDRLGIEEVLTEWLTFVLNKNYRTDMQLLQVYQDVFFRLNNHSCKLLSYDPDKDVLTSSINHNAGISMHEIYKRVSVNGKCALLPALFSALNELTQKMKQMIADGVPLPNEERTIAILVRENWQAEEVRKEGKQFGFSNIVTHTGGDLYQSAPAIDLLILLNALLNNEQPEHLANLLTSNFYGLRLDKTNLYKMRFSSSWMQRNEEKAKNTQATYLISLINQKLEFICSEKITWQELTKSLKTKPILQVLRKLYQELRPWQHYSEDDYFQQFYRINTDLLFEKTVDACSVDMLTIHSLTEFIQTCIVTKRQEDCRRPLQENKDINIICTTVHKAKGLEYGWVVLPYIGFPIDKMKKRDMDITLDQKQIGYRMKLSDDTFIQNDHFNYQAEVEERMREETRILYVAMTRAIRSFIWLDTNENKRNVTWQSILRGD